VHSATQNLSPPDGQLTPDSEICGRASSGLRWLRGASVSRDLRRPPGGDRKSGAPRRLRGRDGLDRTGRHTEPCGCSSCANPRRRIFTGRVHGDLLVRRADAGGASLPGLRCWARRSPPRVVQPHVCTAPRPFDSKASVARGSCATMARRMRPGHLPTRRDRGPGGHSARGDRWAARRARRGRTSSSRVTDADGRLHRIGRDADRLPLATGAAGHRVTRNPTRRRPPARSLPRPRRRSPTLDGPALRPRTSQG